jgi:hypothetical protein
VLKCAAGVSQYQLGNQVINSIQIASSYSQANGLAEGLHVQATEFESRHPVLIQQLIIGAAWATYLFDRDDVVWRFVRQYPQRRTLEHLFFLFATLLIGAGAALCTWARLLSPASEPPGWVSRAAIFGWLRYPQQLGDWLFAVGLASLLPLWGCVFLIAGESIRVIRLVRRYKLATNANRPAYAPLAAMQDVIPGAQWGRAFRAQAIKWGIFLTMIVFSVTLADRQADILVAASVIVAALLNLPAWLKQRR